MHNESNKQSNESKPNEPSYRKISLAAVSKRKGAGFSTLPLLYGFAATIATKLKAEKL